MSARVVAATSLLGWWLYLHGIAQAQQVNDNAVPGNCNAVGVGNQVTCITQQVGSEVLRDIAKGNATTARETQRHIDARLAALESKLDRTLDLPSRVQLQAALEKARGELTEWVAKAQALEVVLQGPELAPALELLRNGDLNGAEQALMAVRAKQQQADTELEKRLLEHKQAAAEVEYALGSVAHLKFQFEAAAHHFRAAVRQYRSLRSEGHHGFDDQRADALSSLGVTYRELGRPAEALKAIRVATAIYRALVVSQRDVYLPDLARCLGSMGIRYQEMGDFNLALGATEEAVSIHRLLAAAQPAIYRPKLAKTLSHLGAIYGQLKSPGDALRVTEEAIEIYRRLGVQRSTAFRHDLAEGLINLGRRLSEVEERRRAVIATREAVAILRDLKSEPHLAKALNNLGLQLLAVSNAEEALRVMSEAVAIRRQLAAQRPNVFLPDLATSLCNLGRIQDATNDHVRARVTMEEAMAIHRTLIIGSPKLKQCVGLLTVYRREGTPGHDR